MTNQPKASRQSSRKRNRVFLSQSSLDDLIAKTVCRRIKSLGVEVWLDDLDLHAGQEVETAIKDGIRNCDELLVLVSSASLGSPWVNTEIGMAMITDKWITPMLVSLRRDEVPSTIRGHNPQMYNDLETYLQQLRARAMPKGHSKGRRSR